MNNYKYNHKFQRCFVLLGCLVFFTLTGCQKLIDNKPSSTQLLDKEVFKDSVTVKSAILGMYGDLSYSSPYRQGLSTLPGFSADELEFVGNGFDPFINNALLSQNGDVSGLWETPYGIVYLANSLIEGVANGSNLSSKFKAQATAEARFIRAISYFYLVNLFGDVPLVLTTDVSENRTKPRDPSAMIYQQMIEDLKFAQANLPADYSLSGGDRTQANKWVATALLARVYLYQGNWADAEAQSGLLLENNSLFELPGDLSTVFAPNSKEAIFQFYNDANGYTSYASTVLPNPVQQIPKYVFSPQLIAAFEENDARKTLWSGNLVYSGANYTYPKKYQSLISGANTEYYTIFRLAEQYLIRAEARAQQNNISGARADIFAIRDRAGLGVTPANDKASLLLAIEQERRIELNSEWGHRWFDLKRTNRAAAVLGKVKPDWKAEAALYPIPAEQRRLNGKLTQNPGYN